MKNRQDVQDEAVIAAITSLTSASSCSLIMGTGVGKSLVTLRVMGHFKPLSVLWLTNSEKLRDIDAPAEFVKWGYEEYLPVTTFACYQTAYKWTDKHFDFVIADEGDFSLTEEYMKVYENPFTRLLFVSATVTEEKQVLLDEIAPVVFRYTTQDAQRDEILSKSNFVFVDFALNTEKTIHKTTKKNPKGWYVSENESYIYWENQYKSHLINFLKYKKEIDDYYLANPGSYWSQYAAKKKLKDDSYAKMKWASNQRATILSNLDSSANLAKRILKKLEEGDNKTLVFSNLTKQSEKICEHTYNSKNKKGNDSIERLNSGEIKVVGVCSAINRGANLNKVNVAIMESYNSSATALQQRHGRLMRIPVDETATIYVLRPYFLKGVNGESTRFPTRAVGWSEQMLYDFYIDESNSKTIII